MSRRAEHVGVRPYVARSRLDRSADMKVGDKVILVDPVDFECPFCGQPCKAGDEVDHEDSIAVMHYMPTCATYDRLEPGRFLTACLKEYKKRESN